MPRYIDIDDTVKTFEKLHGEESTLLNCYNADWIFSFLESQPTADVQEVVHAYWKETTHITESKRGREIHSKLYNCSNCDAPNGRKKSSYCHWCGAKMDGEREEEVENA